MKIWMTGEIDSSISEKYRNVRKSLEKEINEFLSGMDTEIDTWMFVSIILRKTDCDFPEIFKYHKSKRRIETRVKIDYDSFLSSDNYMARRLAIGGLLRSLDEIEEVNTIKEDVKIFLEGLRS
tara:strand:+ start:1007 stop:1375 length:369 start_codon:yes stop_codon:yes gene_type:complete